MIKVLRGFLAMLALAMSLSDSARVHGQSTPATCTVITVQKMHCDGCAKRIGGKLQEVPGIAKIQYDVEKKLFWVHPQPGKQLSARALWEAVEKGSDTPTRIQGPQGTFDKKPNS